MKVTTTHSARSQRRPGAPVRRPRRWPHALPTRPAHAEDRPPSREDGILNLRREDGILNLRADGRWRQGRAWPRRTGMLAVTAGIVLVAAACGGSPAGSGGSSNTGGSAQSQQLAYAQCMRSHGVADFPDPNPGGGFGSAARNEQSNPHYGTADSACRHLLPNGGGNKGQQNQSQFLRHAQCMRSHGVPGYPDPKQGVNPRTALQQAGINPNSPQVQAASRACAQLLPQGSGS